MKKKLYEVELKPMHSGNGYVVVKASPKLIPAQVEMSIVPNAVYKITVTFGHKIVYFDPKDGNSASSRTLGGVIQLLRKREDLENTELVIDDLTRLAKQLVNRMISDGFIVPDSTLK